MERGHMKPGHYGRLITMVILSFVSMYALMYAMVASLDHVRHNLNQVYMAGLMTVPMVLVELLVMAGMFPSKRLNALLAVASVAAGIVFFVLIRRQVAISDQQFLRSMIPHHSGAILMCEEASIRSPAIRDLCANIVSSQRAEIAQMQALLGDEVGDGDPR